MAGAATKKQRAQSAKLRTIVEGKTFKIARAALGKSVKRVDEIIDGALFVIARNPEKFHAIAKTDGVRIVTTDPFPGAPRMRIYFRGIDESTCELLWIEEAPISAEEDLPDEEDCEE